MGDFPTTTPFNGGQIVIAPPAANAAAQFTSTASNVYAAFESMSPAARVANALGYPTADVFRASYTDKAFGKIDPTTHTVTPVFDSAQVWIVLYENVQWPRGGKMGGGTPGPAGNDTPTTASTVPGVPLSAPEDVVAILSPSGDLLDTRIFPAG